MVKNNLENVIPSGDDASTVIFRGVEYESYQIPFSIIFEVSEQCLNKINDASEYITILSQMITLVAPLKVYNSKNPPSLFMAYEKNLDKKRDHVKGFLRNLTIIFERFEVNRLSVIRICSKFSIIDDGMCSYLATKTLETFCSALDNTFIRGAIRQAIKDTIVPHLGTLHQLPVDRDHPIRLGLLPALEQLMREHPSLSNALIALVLPLSEWHQAELNNPVIIGLLSASVSHPKDNTAAKILVERDLHRFAVQTLMGVPSKTVAKDETKSAAYIHIVRLAQHLSRHDPVVAARTFANELDFPRIISNLIREFSALCIDVDPAPEYADECLSASLDALTALVRSFPQCGERVFDGLKILDTAILICASRDPPPLPLASAIDLIRSCIEILPHKPSIKYGYVTDISFKLDRFRKILSFMGGDRYSLLFAHARRKEVPNEPPVAAPPFNELNSRLMETSGERNRLHPAFNALNVHLNDNGRERIVFNCLNVPDANVRLCAAGCISEVPTDMLDEAEVEALTRIFLESRSYMTNGDNERVVGKLLDIMTRLAVEFESSGGKAFMNGKNVRAVVSTCSMLEENLSRNTFGDEDESAEKEYLSLRCTRFLRAISDCPGPAKDQIKDESCRRCLRRALKSEDTQYKYNSQMLGIERSAVGEDAEFLTDMFEGADRVMSTRPLAFLLLQRLADVLMGRPILLDAGVDLNLSMCLGRESRGWNEEELRRDIGLLPEVDQEERKTQQHKFLEVNGPQRIIFAMKALVSQLNRATIYGDEALQYLLPTAVDDLTDTSRIEGFTTFAGRLLAMVEDFSDLRKWEFKKKTIEKYNREKMNGGGGGSSGQAVQSWSQEELKVIQTQSRVPSLEQAARSIGALKFGDEKKIRPTDLVFRCLHTTPRCLSAEDAAAKVETGDVFLITPGVWQDRTSASIRRQFAIAALLRVMYALVAFPASEEIRVFTVRSVIADNLAMRTLSYLIQSCRPLECQIASKFLMVMTHACRLPKSIGAVPVQAAQIQDDTAHFCSMVARPCHSVVLRALQASVDRPDDPSAMSSIITPQIQMLLSAVCSSLISLSNQVRYVKFSDVQPAQDEAIDRLCRRFFGGNVIRFLISLVIIDLQCIADPETISRAHTSLSKAHALFLPGSTFRKRMKINALGVLSAVMQNSPGLRYGILRSFCEGLYVKRQNGIRSTFFTDLMEMTAMGRTACGLERHLSCINGGWERVLECHRVKHSVMGPQSSFNSCLLVLTNKRLLFMKYTAGRRCPVCPPENLCSSPPYILYERNLERLSQVIRGPVSQLLSLSWAEIAPLSKFAFEEVDGIIFEQSTVRGSFVSSLWSVSPYSNFIPDPSTGDVLGYDLVMHRTLQRKADSLANRRPQEPPTPILALAFGIRVFHEDEVPPEIIEEIRQAEEAREKDFLETNLGVRLDAPPPPDPLPSPRFSLFMLTETHIMEVEVNPQKWVMPQGSEDCKMLDFLVDGSDAPGGCFSIPVDTIPLKATPPFMPGMSAAEIEEALRKSKKEREDAEKLKFAEDAIRLAGTSVAPPWDSYLGPLHPPQNRDKALADRITQMAKDGLEAGDDSLLGAATNLLKYLGNVAANTVQIENLGGGGVARSLDDYERRKFDATIDMFRCVWQTPINKLTRISFSGSETPSLYLTVMGRFRVEFQMFDDTALDAFRSGLALAIGCDLSIYEKVEWEGTYLGEEDAVRKKINARKKREEEEAARLKEKRRKEEEKRRLEEEDADDDEDED